MPAATPNPHPLANEIATFRRFNRLHTRVIGTLEEGLLHTDYSLPEARILYELATRTAPRASNLAEDLALDPGYLSRLLSRLERDGLVKRRPSAEDARAAELTLTPKGRAAYRKLSALADQQAATLLAPLPAQRREDLIQAMQTIESILAPSSPPRPFTLRPHRAGDMGWVVRSESLGYARQYNWDQTFEALVAQIAGDFITHFDPTRERCWIAEIDGTPMGHIFLVKHPTEPSTAKLRLLYVEPGARGTGVGQTLVNECVAFARTAGYRKIVLWTQSILTGAIHLYQRAGFRLISEEPHHSFGHALIGQQWQLDLD
jgi:DNA-binding MarR family transcriptional regulator/GNAT superfamily N-acetyltransferase